MKRFLAGGFLVLIFIAGAFAPRPAHAQFGGIVHDPLNGIIEAGTKLLTSGISSTLGSLFSSYNVKEYTLDPIAWAISNMVLQSVTGSVVDFINGHGAGGSPLYVQNLSQYLGAIADNKALNFFAEIGTQSNSPFAAAIASSLRTNYLQSTSAQGFWAANQCTLNQASPDINSYLAGANFSQNGGWGAWFALTTQPQNNPYSLYYSAQAELESRVNTAQAQKNQQLAYSSGFLSWCTSSGEAAGGSPSSTATNVSGIGGTYAATKGATNPGDSCTNPDGSSGTIATPGSVLANTLNKSVDSGVDKLVSSDEFGEILSQLVSGLVGEVVGISGGGLYGLSQGNNSYTNQLRTQGATAATGSGSSGAANAQSTAQNAQQETTSYLNAWQTLQRAAQAASSATQAVIDCESAHNLSDTYGAADALNQVVAPVIAQAATAISSAQAKLALAARVQTEANSTAAGSVTTLTTDLETLVSTPPSETDVTDAEGQAEPTGLATSATATSLTITGGSTLDQLQLIATNAGNALSACQTGTQ